MASKKGKKLGKKVRSLPVKSLSNKQARGVKGWWGAASPQLSSIKRGEGRDSLRYQPPNPRLQRTGMPLNAGRPTDLNDQ